VRATVSLCGKVVNMKANALCPDELPWNGTAILDLADVLDEIDGASVPITSAVGVICSIFNRDDDVELGAVSPVTLGPLPGVRGLRDRLGVGGLNRPCRRSLRRRPPRPR
jgi:hypothetical protein